MYPFLTITANTLLNASKKGRGPGCEFVNIGISRIVSRTHGWGQGRYIGGDIGIFMSDTILPEISDTFGR